VVGLVLFLGIWMFGWLTVVVGMASWRSTRGSWWLRPPAVALVRHRAPETRFLPIVARPVPDHPGYFQVNRVDRTGSALPGGWTFLVNPIERTVLRTSGDPDRLDFAAALRRGTRA
jgi:hypothetical protein